MNSQVAAGPHLAAPMLTENTVAVHETAQEKWPQHVKLAFYVNAPPVVVLVGLSAYFGWLFLSMISVGESVASDNGAGMAVAFIGFLSFVVLCVSLFVLSFIIGFLVAAFVTKKKLFAYIAMVLGGVSTAIMSGIFLSWLIG